MRDVLLLCQTSLPVLALRLLKSHLLSGQRGFLLSVETLYFTEHLQSLGDELRAEGIYPSSAAYPRAQGVDPGNIHPTFCFTKKKKKKKEEEIWNNFSGLAHTHQPRLLLPAQLTILTGKKSVVSLL